MVMEVELGTTGRAKRHGVALVDDEDFERVNQFKWSVFKPCNVIYASGAVARGQQGQQPTTEHRRGYRMLMHRFVLGLPPRYPQVDHRDRNGLNNTRANLRISTVSQNAANTGPSRLAEKKSVYRGVSWQDGFWKATLTVDGVILRLGWHRTQERAADAWDWAAVRVWGDYAYLNRPSEELLTWESNPSDPDNGRIVTDVERWANVHPRMLRSDREVFATGGGRDVARYDQDWSLDHTPPSWQKGVKLHSTEEAAAEAVKILRSGGVVYFGHRWSGKFDRFVQEAVNG